MPQKLETAASDLTGQFMTWSGPMIKDAEKMVLRAGNQFFDFLSKGAEEGVKMAGQVMSATFDSAGKSLKGYVADWVGCGSHGQG